MEWIVLFLILVAVTAVVSICTVVIGHRRASQMEDEIRNLTDFDAADVYVSPHNLAGVAIDRTRQEILLVDRDSERVFDVQSIISCEVLEDGIQLAYANRGSQLAGVAVGGALLGGVGAVIGGLSGSQRTVDRVRSIVLRFTTDDFDNPLHDIVLASSPSKKGMPKDGLSYTAALETAQRWHARTVAMMKAADR